MEYEKSVSMNIISGAFSERRNDLQAIGAMVRGAAPTKFDYIFENLIMHLIR